MSIQTTNETASHLAAALDHQPELSLIVATIDTSRSPDRLQTGNRLQAVSREPAWGWGSEGSRSSCSDDCTALPAQP